MLFVAALISLLSLLSLSLSLSLSLFVSGFPLFRAFFSFIFLPFWREILVSGLHTQNTEIYRNLLLLLKEKENLSMRREGAKARAQEARVGTE